MQDSNNMEFSTYDADHDNFLSVNVASEYKGGFWWNQWSHQRVNGYHDFIRWDKHRDLKKTQLMIRPAGEN